MIGLDNRGGCGAKNLMHVCRHPYVSRELIDITKIRRCRGGSINDLPQIPAAVESPSPSPSGRVCSLICSFFHVKCVEYCERDLKIHREKLNLTNMPRTYRLNPQLKLLLFLLCSITAQINSTQFEPSDERNAAEIFKFGTPKKSTHQNQLTNYYKSFL